VSLDEHRPEGKRAKTGRRRDGQLPTQRGGAWYPERPGPEPDTSWYAPFLERLAQIRNVRDAAEHVGIHRQTAYDALARDPRFAEAFAWAKDESRDRVEGVAWSKALDGWEEDVWFDGEVVGTKRVYDAAMLRLILQGVAPEYRTGPAVAVQVNTEVAFQPTDDPKVIDAGLDFLAALSETRSH
jgi:hypothetical protein